jgi:hypothetical protein
MANFYHLYISPRSGIKREDIEAVLSEAPDWFRYDDKNWVLCSSWKATDWYTKLQGFVEPGGHLFICKLDTQDYYGFMTKNLWDWLTKPRWA